MEDRHASISMYIFAISALLSAMSLGCVLGWSSPSIDSMQRNGSCPQINQKSSIDQQYKTWISSCITLGALGGSLLSGVISQWLGRRKTLIFLCVPFIVGWTFICFATNFLLIILGRVITGFSGGIASSVAPSYVADIVTPSTRGFLGTCFQILICVGQLYMIIFGKFLEWNQLAYVAIIPVILSSVGMFFASESPIILILEKKESEAQMALERIRKPMSDIETEFHQLYDRAHANQSHKSLSTSSILKRPDVYHPLIIANLLMFFQQFSGVNAVMFYLVTIFKESGSSLDSQVASILVNLALVVTTFISGLVMDKFGRKILLSISGFGNAICMSIMGVYYFKIYPENGWIPVAVLIVFVTFFSIGYGPIPWMIVSEITPHEASKLVSSTATATNWLCAFFITKEFDQMVSSFTKYGTYWMFAGFCSLSTIYTTFFVPETKHRTIQDIQNHFLKK